MRPLHDTTLFDLQQHSTLKGTTALRRHGRVLMKEHDMNAESVRARECLVARGLHCGTERSFI